MESAKQYYNDKPKDEMLDGKIYLMSLSPSISHGRISMNLSRIFSNYLWKKPCDVFSEMDVHFSQKDRFKPDLTIVCNNDIVKKNGIFGAPDLIIEILSLSTASRDKGYKKNIYESSGVKEYWLVSAVERSVEVYLLKDGKYELDEIYVHVYDYELEEMTEEERALIITELKTSIFDDLVIQVEDIFEGII